MKHQFLQRVEHSLLAIQSAVLNPSVSPSVRLTVRYTLALCDSCYFQDSSFLMVKFQREHRERGRRM